MLTSGVYCSLRGTVKRGPLGWNLVAPALSIALRWFDPFRQGSCCSQNCALEKPKIPTAEDEWEHRSEAGPRLNHFYRAEPRSSPRMLLCVPVCYPHNPPCDRRVTHLSFQCPPHCLPQSLLAAPCTSCKDSQKNCGSQNWRNPR